MDIQFLERLVSQCGPASKIESALTERVELGLDLCFGPNWLRSSGQDLES